MHRGIRDRVHALESRRERDVDWFGGGVNALVLSDDCDLLKKLIFIERDSSDYFGTVSLAFALPLRRGELWDVSTRKSMRSRLWIGIKIPW